MSAEASGSRSLARGRAAQHWRLRPVDEALARRLAVELDAPPLLARLLAQRGVASADDARLFLDAPLAGLHDPFEMKGMEEAAAHLAREVEEGRPVGVYGDYDVDGITATALLLRFFASLGVPAHYHIPRRLEEGYGLHLPGLLRLREAGCRTVVTVDCGIAGADAAAEAKRAGIHLIVTDHHRPPERLPEAVAVLNPRQPGCSYPFKGLSGAGVAFKLAAAVRRRLRDRGFARPLPNLKQHLDLVALGTVADVAPLLGENHILVRAGLEVLSAPPAPAVADPRKAGIRALQAAADLKADAINTGHIGFVLGPRLNAAGRVGDPSAGVELLRTDDLADARARAEIIEEWNRQRQELQQEALDEAEALLAAAGEAGLDGAIVLASEGWHPGVIGIVASKLVEGHRLPAALIRLDGAEGRGSVRGWGSFHVYRALEGCADCLVQFGGHRQAAGLTLRREMVDAFRARFQAAARTALGPELGAEEVWLDAPVGFSDLDIPLVERLEGMAPFGPENPRPVLATAGVEVRATGFAGREGDHLKLALRHQGRSMEAIGFGMGPLAREEGLLAGKIDVAYCACLNRWRGSTKLQLELKAIRPAGASAGETPQ